MTTQEKLAALLQEAENYRASNWAGAAWEKQAAWLVERGVRVVPSTVQGTVEDLAGYTDYCHGVAAGGRMAANFADMIAHNPQFDIGEREIAAVLARGIMRHIVREDSYCGSPRCQNPICREEEKGFRRWAKEEEIPQNFPKPQK